MHKVITNLEDTKLDSLIIYGAERAGSAIYMAHRLASIGRGPTYNIS